MLLTHQIRIRVRTKPKQPTTNMSSHEVVPLIRVEKDGLYSVDEDTLAWLKQRTSPFAVMMVAGKFRTGKSFLLNELLGLPSDQGFGVGGTVQACTRGIWVCKHFLPGWNGGPDVLVMDTEGIDALDVESSHDIRIFALAVLLGSIFCFKSKDHIDEAAIQTLSLMTRVASSMTTVKHNPTMYWVLRDFQLEMVDEHGAKMSHESYLERALTHPSSAKCATRDAIKTLFPTRHLVTLPRPHKQEGSGRLDKVNVKFQKFLNIFRDHVVKNAHPTKAHGVDMTGAVYTEHVRNLVDMVNKSDSVPPIEDAWTMLIRSQHADAISNVKKQLLSLVQAESPYGSESVVQEWIHTTCEGLSATTFMELKPDIPSWRNLQGRIFLLSIHGSGTESG